MLELNVKCLLRDSSPEPPAPEANISTSTSPLITKGISWCTAKRPRDIDGVLSSSRTADITGIKILRT